jgi:hypothetical protein
MPHSTLLPSACKCGNIAGVIINQTVVCTECGATRANVSPVTQRTLDQITALFGEVSEPVVFRNKQAKERIEKQDAYLKRRRTPHGKSWFDVITENFGAVDATEIDEPLTDPETED